MKNPDLFVRVSLPHGHFTVPAAIAARDSSWKVLKKQDATDANGVPLPPKLRVDIAAATPSTESETPVSADTEESE